MFSLPLNIGLLKKSMLAGRVAYIIHMSSNMLYSKFAAIIFVLIHKESEWEMCFVLFIKYALHHLVLKFCTHVVDNATVPQCVCLVCMGKEDDQVTWSLCSKCFSHGFHYSKIIWIRKWPLLLSVFSFCHKEYNGLQVWRTLDNFSIFFAILPILLCQLYLQTGHSFIWALYSTRW